MKGVAYHGTLKVARTDLQLLIQTQCSEMSTPSAKDEIISCKKKIKKCCENEKKKYEQKGGKKKRSIYWSFACLICSFNVHFIIYCIL